MSESTAVIDTPIDEVNLPLNFDATNPEHVEKIEVYRARLCGFLLSSGYAPRAKESADFNPFRDNLLLNFAELLVIEELIDEAGEGVGLYDAADFVAWLYHGYKWLNANVTNAYETCSSSPTPVMGFVMKKDESEKTLIFQVKKKDDPSPQLIPAMYTGDNWCSWSNPQMIRPLGLNKSSLVTSQQKTLYRFFCPTKRDKVATTEVPTLSAYISAAQSKPVHKKKGPKTGPATGGGTKKGKPSPKKEGPASGGGAGAPA
jgi:hypothetical protein